MPFILEGSFVSIRAILPIFSPFDSSLKNNHSCAKVASGLFCAN